MKWFSKKPANRLDMYETNILKEIISGDIELVSVSADGITLKKEHLTLIVKELGVIKIDDGNGIHDYYGSGYLYDEIMKHDAESNKSSLQYSGKTIMDRYFGNKTKVKSNKPKATKIGFFDTLFMSDEDIAIIEKIMSVDWDNLSYVGISKSMTEKNPGLAKSGHFHEFSCNDCKIIFYDDRPLSMGNRKYGFIQMKFQNSDICLHRYFSSYSVINYLKIIISRKGHTDIEHRASKKIFKIIEQSLDAVMHNHKISVVSAI